MTADFKGNVAGQVARLFSAFERGVKPERAALYVQSLSSVPIDRLEAAIGWVIEHWEEKSPPPIAKIRHLAWHGTPGTKADDESERERVKVLLYYLMRYSDADYYVFKNAFGFAPTRVMYEKFAESGRREFGSEWRVPEGVSFSPPDPAWCKAERERAQLAAHQAFHRLGRKHKAAVPMPEQMAKAVQDAIAKTAQQEVPF